MAGDQKQAHALEPLVVGVNGTAFLEAKSTITSMLDDRETLQHFLMQNIVVISDIT